MRRYTRHTKETLEPIVKISKSIAECLRHLSLSPKGGNYNHFNKLVDKFNLDTSHFVGQAHNKGKEFIPFDSLIKPSSIKNRLIKEFGHRCFECLNSEWLGQPIPLELEHTNGNNRDNSKDNLRLLCCNCHALTPTWRNRKR